MSTKSDLKALDALMNSRGWAIIRERMEQEVVAAALQIGKAGGMTTDEIHFRRGSIWAAQQLLDVPAKLKAILQSQQPFEPKSPDAAPLDDKVAAPPLSTSDEPR